MSARLRNQSKLTIRLTLTREENMDNERELSRRLDLMTLFACNLYYSKFRRDLEERVIELWDEYGESNGDLCWELGDEDDLKSLARAFGIR